MAGDRDREVDEKRSQEGWQPSPFLRLSGALHAAVAVGVAFYPSRWPWAIGLIAADHLVLAAAGMWPRSTLLGENLRRLAVHEAGDTVALTFDDGPDPEVTPRVLDHLEAGGSRASFFCVGRRAEAYPELVAEIVARGHRVENHTFFHRNTFAFRGPKALGREIDRAQRVLAECAGSAPQYFRAPAGIRNPWLDPVLARRGLRLVSWTRRGFDAIDRDADRVAARLLRDLGAGDVLLMHDGSLVRTGGNAVTLEVLPRILESLDRAGLRGVPLPRRGEAA